MALSVSQKVVLNKENTWASARSAPTSDHLALPVETANINLVIEPFNDQTKKGAASLDAEVYQTVRRVEGSIEGPFFVDECAYFLMALLGDQATIATGTPNTHTFKAKTNFAAGTANSLTIDVRDDAQNLEFSGCYVSALTLRFSAAEGILTYSASMVGQDQATALTLTDAAFADKTPPFGWTGFVKRAAESRTADTEATIAATSNICTVIDAEFTINRPTALTYTFCDTDLAYRADPGPLEVTARLTLDFDTGQDLTPTTLINDYVNNTHYGWLFELDNNLSAGNKRLIRFYMPSMSPLESPLEIDRSDTAIRLNAGFRAVHNSVAAINGPIRIKTTSDRAVNYAS
jgi:hypothetical protein